MSGIRKLRPLSYFKIYHPLNKDFIIKGDKLVKYCGNDKIVKVPDGIKELGSSCFWDNFSIENVILPESLINLGGDTFYNCANLRSLVVPKNVKTMGNNPFAGCPSLKLVNKSSSFIFKNNTLYNKEKTRLIYLAINAKDKTFRIANKTLVIG